MEVYVYIITYVYYIYTVNIIVCSNYCEKTETAKGQHLSFSQQRKPIKTQTSSKKWNFLRRVTDETPIQEHRLGASGCFGIQNQPHVASVRISMKHAVLKKRRGMDSPWMSDTYPQRWERQVSWKYEVKKSTKHCISSDSQTTTWSHMSLGITWPYFGWNPQVYSSLQMFPTGRG